MAKSKAEAQAAPIVFGTTVHIAGDVAASPEEQIEAAVRAFYPDFDPATHSVSVTEAGDHPEDAGARLVAVEVSVTPAAPAEPDAE